MIPNIGWGVAFASVNWFPFHENQFQVNMQKLMVVLLMTLRGKKTFWSHSILVPSEEVGT